MFVAAKLCYVNRAWTAPMILKQDVGHQAWRQNYGGNQKNDRAPRHQQLATWKQQFDHKRGDGGRHQKRSDPEADIARLHQRRVETEGEFVVGEVLETVEIAGNAQVEFGIKAEGQSGDDTNGKRDQKSGAVHAGFVYPTRR